MLFDLDFNKLPRQYLRIRLRKPRILAFLSVIFHEIGSVYNQFLSMRAQQWYELRHTGVVVHLEGILNDAFDATERRIKIANGQLEYAPVYVFQPSELSPVYLYQASESEPPEYLFAQQEVEFEGNDFVVEVPTAVTFDMARLRAIVDKYKLPGVVYAVEIV